MKKSMRLFRAFLCVLSAAAVLGGCYLPSEFKADLRIAPNGNYNFKYEGLLVYLPLVKKLSDGELSAEALQKEVSTIDGDLGRDSGFKEIAYIDRGTFRVRYARVGNIVREKSFNFVRSSARMLSIERRLDGTVHVIGDKPNKSLATQLARGGFVVRGTLRVQTEAEVVRHNATEVTEAAAKLYIWQIEGVERKSPRLVFNLQGR